MPCQCNKFTFEEKPDVFQMFHGGGGAVKSVNGKTGVVVLTAEDVGALPDTYEAPVTSVNEKTGAVVLAAGDIGYDGETTYPDASVGKELGTINSALSSLESVTQIIDTASGAIASFPDGSGLPMRSLVAQINPVQDLHGQPSPYPAGGGKNLFDVDSLISGGITGQGGDATNTGWRRTPYMFMKAGTYTISRSTADWWKMFKYSEQSTSSIIGQVFNNNVRLTETFTLDSDCYCRFGFDYIPTTADAVQLESGSTATAWSPYSNLCPITGHTGLSVEVRGKNLFAQSKQISKYIYRATTIPIEGNENAFYLSGANGSQDSPTLTVSAWANVTIAYDYKFKEDTVVTFSCKIRNYTNLGNAPGYVILGYATKIPMTTGSDFTALGERANFSTVGINEITLTRTVPAGNYIALKFCPVNSGQSVTLTQQDDVYDIQLELGSSASSYEPYTSGTTTTVSWQTEAGTVYGGTLDVVSGDLTLIDVHFTDKWKNGYGSSIGSFTRKTFTTTLTSNYPNFTHTPKSNVAPYKANFSEDSLHFYVNAATENNILVFLPNDTDGETDIEVCFELAEPIHYTLTPQQVSTLLGQNNVWHDANGDTTVTYQASIKGYIDKVLAS